MHRRRIRWSQRGLAIGVALGLLASVAGTETAVAKAKAKPTTAAQCKKNGYKKYGFKNQGACVRYVNAHKKTATTKKPTATTAKPSTGGTTAKGTVKIGILAAEVNSRGTVVPQEAKQISRAWADTMNAAGGVNGYKIELVYKNTNEDSARALNAIKEMDAAGVIAFTQNISSMLPPIRDYMSQKSIPVVGGQPYTNEFDWHPMFFHFSGQAIGVYGQVAAARDVGAKHFRNEYCTEVAACGTSVAETKYAAEREGLKFSSEGASAVAADYTANCLSAKNAGVDFFQSNGLNFANVVRDCARQNFHPTYGIGGLTCGILCVDQGKGENIAGNLYEFGIFYNGPEVQRFRQALARTDFRVDDGTATQASVQVWLGMEMIGAALKHMTAPNPTRQDFLEGMYSLKNDTLGGQIPPVDFTVQRPGTGKHATSDCWTEYIAKDGKFFHMDTNGQVANKLTFICGTGLKLNDHEKPM